MTRFIPLFILLLLSGCVGGFVFTPTVTTHKSPGIGLLEERGEVAEYSPSTPAIYDKHQITTLWGDPDAVEITGDGERWKYDVRYMWCGAIPFIVIPVPLLVPCGRRYAVLEFTGRNLTKIEHHHEEGAGGMCGIINPHTFFGCVGTN